jgi:acetyl-CoA carboxylase carboxyl transferase subunit alpha
MSTATPNPRPAPLDFELELVKLEDRITDMKKWAEEYAEKGQDANIEQEITKLESRANELRTALYNNLTHWQRVQVARHRDRPYTLDYISVLMEDFTELHGDRSFADDAAMVCGIAQFRGRSVAIIGQQKGRTIEQRVKRNFGMAGPEGYRKALRIMRLAEKFHMPVLSFIDTPGAAPGVGAEERGQAEAIARNLYEMSKLRTPILISVIGEGASGGALGIGVGDRVLMMENCWYSVISPEGCAQILWRTAEAKQEAAAAMKISAFDLLELHLIDEVVKEPLGGAHRAPAEAAAILGDRIEKHLIELTAIPIPQLLTQRRARLYAYGQWSEPEEQDHAERAS